MRLGEGESMIDKKVRLERGIISIIGILIPVFSFFINSSDYLFPIIFIINFVVITFLTFFDNGIIKEKA